MNSKKKIIILIVIAVLVVALAIVGFILLRNKKEIVKDYTVSVVNKIVLTEENQKITVNDKTVNVRMFENELYVNDIKNEDIMLEGEIYVTDKYILITDDSEFGYFVNFATDETGRTINIDNKIKTEAEYPMYNIKNFRVENGILVGDYYNDDCALMPKDSEDCNSKVEFIYNGKTVIIQDKEEKEE